MWTILSDIFMWIDHKMQKKNNWEISSNNPNSPVAAWIKLRSFIILSFIAKVDVLFQFDGCDRHLVQCNYSFLEQARESRGLEIQRDCFKLFDFTVDSKLEES